MSFKVEVKGYRRLIWSWERGEEGIGKGLGIGGGCDGSVEAGVVFEGGMSGSGFTTGVGEGGTEEAGEKGVADAPAGEAEVGVAVEGGDEQPGEARERVEQQQQEAQTRRHQTLRTQPHLPYPVSVQRWHYPPVLVHYRKRHHERPRRYRPIPKYTVAHHQPYQLK